MNTGIEWTDRTWNPVRGCSRVSEGCRNCYAERQAARYSGPYLKGRGPTGPFHGFAEQTPTGPRWTGRVELIPEKLDEPLRWRKPARVFVNSMSDLFHEALSDEAIAAVFGVMSVARLHAFQVLTKRPEGMRRWVSSYQGKYQELHEAVKEAMGYDHPRRPAVNEPDAWPLPNVWLGVSVEDQATADERIPLLLQTPAAVRFVSYEPALGPVNLNVSEFWGAMDRTRLHGGMSWVIVGGESGPGARPCDVAWIRSAVAQCREAGVPVFVKQLGARVVEMTDYPREYPLYMWPSVPSKGDRRMLRDRKGGDPAEWPDDLRVREFPEEAQ